MGKGGEFFLGKKLSGRQVDNFLVCTQFFGEKILLDFKQSFMLTIKIKFQVRFFNFI